MLYLKYKRGREVEYRLPEGINTIHKSSIVDNSKINGMLKVLADKCNGKKFIMPATLKSIGGDFFDLIFQDLHSGFSLDIELNKQLEELHYRALWSLDRVVLPPNVRVIDKAINFKNL